MKKERILRVALWVAFNGGLAGLTFLAFEGSAGARRCAMLIVWFSAMENVLAGFSKSARRRCRERGRPVPGRPVPGWLSHLAGAAFVGVFVFYGWVWTGIAMLVNEVFEAVIYDEEEDEKEVLG